MEPHSDVPSVTTGALSGLLSALRDNRQAILSLRDHCGKREDSLASIYYTTLAAHAEKFSVSGLFGWDEHKADHLVTVQANTFVSECKKVTEQGEYGYWHALIQAAIYRHKANQYQVVCTVFDWGRKAGVRLQSPEISFLSPWIEDQIYVVRISLANNYFIEHNLQGEWKELR